MAESCGELLEWTIVRNLLPAWLDLTLLAITWAAIGWRLMATHSEGAPRRLTESLAAGAVALTLKVGPIYDVVVQLTGPAVLRALIHGACLVAVAAVLCLWFATQGDVKNPKLVPSLYVASGVLTVLLVVMAKRAPRTGDQMESAPDGWALAYFAVFCIPTVVGLILLVTQLVRSWKMNRSRAIGAVVTLTFVFLVIDNLSIFVGVVFSILFDDHSLIENRGVPNGVSFAVLVTIGAVVSAIVVNRGAEARWVDPMTAMWLDLRAMCPDIALSAPWSLHGREQRLRATVESVDALAQLAPLVSRTNIAAARDTVEGPPALVLAIALQDAADEHHGRGPTDQSENLLAADAVEHVGELSAHWPRARQLRRATRDGGEKGFPGRRNRSASQTH